MHRALIIHSLGLNCAAVTSDESPGVSRLEPEIVQEACLPIHG